MMDQSSGVVSIIENFVSALEQGDMAALDACFAPGVRIWHNFDQKYATAEENAASVRDYFGNFRRRDYQDRRLALLPKGALLQFVIDLESANGKTFRWPGCIVFEVLEGKISLIEEYVDLSGLGAALG